jgi:pilus assembly protein CpaC
MSIQPGLWTSEMEACERSLRAARMTRRIRGWSRGYPLAGRVGAAALFVTVLSSLGFAAWKSGPPPLSPAPGAGSYLMAVPALTEQETPTESQQEARITPGRQLSIRTNPHRRLILDRNLERVAGGSPEIVDARLINTRELLVLGKKPGQTSVLVWYEDGTVEQIDVIVAADLGLLERTLIAIHPSIMVEKAPDRDALVLTGQVPRAIYARRAEDIVLSWLSASPSSAELLVGAAAERAADAQTSAGVGATRAGRSGSVINLIQVDGLPAYGLAAPTEEQLLEAIQDIGGEDVRVRRIQKGPVADDEVDILVLEGTVLHQVALTRILSLAYKIYVGNVKGPDVSLTDGVTGTTRVFDGSNLAIGDDIKVIANEAGALLSDQGGSDQQSQSLLSGFGQSSSGGSGGSGGLGSGGLNNEIETNIARASALELAGGRILSFIEVLDLPQVRVDIRVFEVNRTKLLAYQSDLGVLVSDFSQGGLNPAGAASTVQGAGAARVGSSGGSDIQNAFGFLQGTLTNQLQLSGSNWAIDSLFSFLESESVARSLANPSLSVLSGEVALFEVGGRVPIDVSFGTQVGIQGVFNSTRFIDFGVKLAVRPLVGEDDYVTIDFAPEIITPDAILTQALVEATGANPTTFAFESRLLKTSARLLDGQTMLVGGLQQTLRSDEDDKAPWLSDVPLLGLLFQGFDYSDDDLEVVVMIRPTIVRDPIPDVGLWAYPNPTELMQSALPERRVDPDPPAPGEFEEEGTGKVDEPETEAGEFVAGGEQV